MFCLDLCFQFLPPEGNYMAQAPPRSGSGPSQSLFLLSSTTPSPYVRSGRPLHSSFDPRGWRRYRSGFDMFHLLVESRLAASRPSLPQDDFSGEQPCEQTSDFATFELRNAPFSSASSLDDISSPPTTHNPFPLAKDTRTAQCLTPATPL